MWSKDPLFSKSEDAAALPGFFCYLAKLLFGWMRDILLQTLDLWSQLHKEKLGRLFRRKEDILKVSFWKGKKKRSPVFLLIDPLTGTPARQHLSHPLSKAHQPHHVTDHHWSYSSAEPRWSGCVIAAVLQVSERQRPFLPGSLCCLHPRRW